MLLAQQQAAVPACVSQVQQQAGQQGACIRAPLPARARRGSIIVRHAVRLQEQTTAAVALLEQPAPAAPGRRRRARSSSTSNTLPGLHQHQQQRRHQPDAELADGQLTQLISSSPSWEVLAALLAEQQQRCGPIHTAAAITRLAKLLSDHQQHHQQQQQQHRRQHQRHDGGRQQQLLLLLPSGQQGVQLQGFINGLLLPLLARNAAAMGARALANSLWGLSKLGVVPPAPLLLLLQRRLAAAAAAGQLEPQHISSVLYSLAQWQQQQQWQHAQQQQQQQQAQWQQQQQQQQQQAQWQQAQWQQQQQAQGQQAQQHQQQAQPQQPQPGVALSAAGARQQLGIRSELTAALMSAAAARLGAFGSQALANTLYAVAVLELLPEPGWLAAFWQCSPPALAAAQPQHVSNLLYAAARLQLQPPRQWRVAVLAASAQLLRESTAQGCSNSLWAVARLGWAEAAVEPGSSSSSSSWLEVFVAATSERLDSFSDQGLSNCCWALGSLARQQQQQQQQQPELQRLLLSSGWLQRLLAVLQPRLLALTPRQLSNVCWGLAACASSSSSNSSSSSDGQGVAALVAPWISGAFVAASGPRLLSFNSQDAANSLVALARLGCQPGASWLRLYELLLQQQLGSCSSQVLSNSLWAMRRLQHQPSEALLQRLLPEACRRLRLAAAAAPSGGVPGSSASSSLAFTPHGLAVLLLSLVQLQPPGGLPGDFWQLVARTLIVDHSGSDSQGSDHQQQQQQDEDGSRPTLLAGLSGQGLAFMAGAAALSEGDAAEQLVLAALQQVAQRVVAQQQQPSAEEQQQPSQDEQKQQQLSGASLHDVQLLDLGMVIWAAGRLQARPPPAHLLLLARHALQQLQQQLPRLRGNGGDSPGCERTSDLPAAADRGLGALVHGLGLLGYHPGSAWFAQLFVVTGPLLPLLRPQTLVLLLWGVLALLQLPPAGWLEGWADAWRQHQQQEQPRAGEMRVARQVAAAAGRQGLQLAAAARREQQLAGSSDATAAASLWFLSRRLAGSVGVVRQRQQQRQQ